MSMRLLTAMVVVAILAMSAMVAMAADGDQQRGPRQNMDPAERWAQLLGRFDKDNDGKISRDEFKGPDKVFDRLDKDEDGAITEEEAMQAAGNPGGRQKQDPAAQFARMVENWDADGDGQISKDEWKGRPENFAKLDGDGDAFVTEQEFVDGMAQMMKRRNPVQEMVALWDTDADGRVSWDEWAAFFAIADVNDDGFLSQDELMKALRPPKPDAPANDAPPPAAPGGGFAPAAAE